MEKADKCKGCTSCCELNTISEINKEKYKMCKHCNGSGCSIYDNRPISCKKYYCSYAQVDNANIELRPDNCKMIFERATDDGDIFLAVQDIKFEITDVARKQIFQFNKQGFSVILHLKDERIVFPKEGITGKEVMQKFGEIIEKLKR
jgi:hypothetical protein